MLLSPISPYSCRRPLSPHFSYYSLPWCSFYLFTFNLGRAAGHAGSQFPGWRWNLHPLYWQHGPNRWATGEVPLPITLDRLLSPVGRS